MLLKRKRPDSEIVVAKKVLLNEFADMTDAEYIEDNSADSKVAGTKTGDSNNSNSDGIMTQAAQATDSLRDASVALDTANAALAEEEQKLAL